MWPLTESCLNGECVGGVCVCPDNWSGINNALNMEFRTCTYNDSVLWGFRVANLLADLALLILLVSKMAPYIRSMYGRSSKLPSSQVAPTPPGSNVSADESSAPVTAGTHSPKSSARSTGGAAAAASSSSSSSQKQAGGKSPAQKMLGNMTFRLFCGTIFNMTVRVILIIVDATTRQSLTNVSAGAYVFLWGLTFSIWWEIFFVTLYNIFKTAWCSINSIKMHDKMVLPPEVAKAHNIKRIGNWSVLVCFAGFTYLAAVPSSNDDVKHALWALGFFCCSFFCAICAALVIFSSKAVITCLDSMIAQAKSDEEKKKLAGTRKGWWLFRVGLGFVLAPYMGVILLLPFIPVVTLAFANYLVYLCCCAATIGSFLVTYVQKLRLEDSHD